MATSYKILGQAAPGAATLTGLYTVPAATSTVVATFSACNRDTSPTTFRLSIAVAGAADTVAQYLHYAEPIPAGKTFTKTVGLTLAATDVVRVQSGNGLASFSAWGAEVT